ncbi:hypothetical protein D3C73_897590 [compost metagenome]
MLLAGTVRPTDEPDAVASARASCINVDQEPAGAELPQPVIGVGARGDGRPLRPLPTDWVMIRRVLEERARYGV